MLSRYWALWGIVEVAPEAVKAGALKLFTVSGMTFQLNLISLLFCWSATEILRYGFYAAKVKYPRLSSALQTMCTCSAYIQHMPVLTEMFVSPDACCMPGKPHRSSYQQGKQGGLL